MPDLHRLRVRNYACQRPVHVLPGIPARQRLPANGPTNGGPQFLNLLPNVVEVD